MEYWSERKDVREKYLHVYIDMVVMDILDGRKKHDKILLHIGDDRLR